ncbi:choline kinase [Mergibacter septicus]|uniref:Choline kinase n=2 Tax=Mergibacter septicus TaxID=221402 RepID=A0A8D4LJX6_9PAST|nr:choline kinase family protein [Mergibacter septicus]AWX15320.1 choline kinase [Mergibacter septicus]QDJ14574.1 choline kinase [Mergibacter septicus]UTU47992.1 phosphotransferase [Mergibacter septicus]WMR96400.1 phosphotransferase [Mergibacter septicus]
MNIAQIVNLFCQFLHYPQEKIIDCQIIGGMTNCNYLITTKDLERFVFRVSGNGSNDLINRYNEYENSVLAQNLGINPKIVFFDEKNGYKVTEYIPSARTLSPYSISAKLDKILSLLKLLHNSEIKFSNKLDYLQEYKHYKNLIKKYGIILEKDFLEFEEKALSLYDKLVELGIENKPCHNDLVAENFVMGEGNNEEKLYLIDWEYSSMNDPTWDLASLFLETSISPQAENDFIVSYFSDLTQLEREKQKQKIIIYKILQNTLWYLWTLIKEANGDNFGSYKYRRLEQAKALYADYIIKY